MGDPEEVAILPFRVCSEGLCWETAAPVPIQRQRRMLFDYGYLWMCSNIAILETHSTVMKKGTENYIIILSKYSQLTHKQLYKKVTDLAQVQPRWGTTSNHSQDCKLQKEYTFWCHVQYTHFIQINNCNKRFRYSSLIAIPHMLWGVLQ